MPIFHLLNRHKTPRLSECSNGEILHFISEDPHVFEAWQKQITGLQLHGKWPKDDVRKVQELVNISNRLQDVLLENERAGGNKLNTAQLARLSTLLVLTQQALAKAQATLQDDSSYGEFRKVAKREDGTLFTPKDIREAYGISDDVSSSIRANQSAIDAIGIAKDIQIRLQQNQDTPVAEVMAVVVGIYSKKEVGVAIVAAEAYRGDEGKKDKAVAPKPSPLSRRES